jgi:hypothetical protein
VVHKGPVVFDTCYRVYNDTVAFNETINLFANSGIYFHILENLMWNFADIYLEVKDQDVALGANDFERFGKNIGKMVSDIFIKNPADVAYQRSNSEVLSGMMSIPVKDGAGAALPQGGRLSMPVIQQGGVSKSELR